MNVKDRIKNFIERLLLKQTLVLQYCVRAEKLKREAVRAVNMGVSQDKFIENEVVVSLTTYGKRLNDVYLAIESIMQQTYKPNRIILWLQDNMDSIELPYTLKCQQKRGLEVKYTQDIRSYKKLLPTLKLCPESVIITIDDDVIYEIDTIERLIKAYKKDQHYIYGCRIKKIELNKQGKVKPYSSWNPVKYGSRISNLNICIGVGGVLYPPHCFTKEVFNEEVFGKLCPHADDLWFWLMAKINGYKSAKVITHYESGDDHIPIPCSQEITLRRNNLGKGENDKQFEAIISHYDAYRFLKDE